MYLPCVSFFLLFFFLFLLIYEATPRMYVYVVSLIKHRRYTYACARVPCVFHVYTFFYL